MVSDRKRGQGGIQAGAFCEGAGGQIYRGRIVKKGFLAETTAVLLPEIITVLALNETINQMMIH